VFPVEDAKEESEDIIELVQSYFETASVNKNKTPLALENNDTESEGGFTRNRITEEYRRRSIRSSLTSSQNKPRKKGWIGGTK